MFLKKSISFFLLIISAFLGHAQNTHQYWGTAAGEASGAFGNISWSIGEVVVFNESTTPSGSVSIAQGMQSYPPMEANCALVTLSTTPSVVCDGNVYPKISYTATIAGVNTLADTVQWYYSSGGGSDIAAYSKLGAVNGAQYDATVYFPGYYLALLTFNSAGCKSISSPIHVPLSASIGLSPISANPTPAKPASISVSATGTPTLQWYVNLNGKYLLVAGGTLSELKVRYNGNYMVIASFPNGCRLTSTYDVTGYAKPIFRASDIRIDGDMVYIPEEDPFGSASLMVYPNPAMGTFYIQYQSSAEITSKAELYSNEGVFLKEIEFTEGGTWAKGAKVSTDGLSAGVYFLKIKEENQLLVQKVVIYK